MKHFAQYLLIYTLSMLYAVGVCATDRVTCNFTRGIPTNFTLIDNDGNTPSAGAKKLGFDKGNSWIAWIDDDGNAVAASTSWYTPKGQSDDWMILSALDVKSGAVLAWRAKAIDSRYRDGYAVYVSEKGASIADFDKAQPLFSVSEEEAQWTSREVSLNAYSGKTIYIAFVNNSNNKSRLFVDDIFAGVRKSMYISDVSPRIVKADSTFTVSIAVTNETVTTVENPAASYTLDGATHSVALGKSLAPGETATFTFDNPLCLAVGDSIVPQFATADDALDASISAHRMRAVMEEGTGMWCGYCVRGIVHIRQTKLLHPENFIAIAVHSNDAVSIEDYDVSDVMRNSMGLPDAIINRNENYHEDPEYAEEDCAAALAEPLKASVELAASYDGNGNVLAKTEVRFNDSYDKAPFAMAYILVEDSVHHPENDEYRQHNSYHDNVVGKAMGGFESLPEWVPADQMWYMDVPRTVWGNVKGIAGSVPSGIDAGVAYHDTRTLAMPDNVDDAGQCKLVALLLDQRYNLIVNAAEVKLDNGSTSGIHAVGPIGDGTKAVAAYDLAGRQISLEQVTSANSDGSCIYIVKYANGTVKKLMRR